MFFKVVNRRKLLRPKNDVEFFEKDPVLWRHQFQIYFLLYYLFFLKSAWIRNIFSIIIILFLSFHVK